LRPDLVAYFDARVEKLPDAPGCWIWMRAIQTSGYGQAYDRIEKRLVSAHKLSYTVARGPVPDGLELLHSCDVRLCCNPEHLSPGTRLDNVRDMDQKGRGRRAIHKRTYTDEERACAVALAAEIGAFRAARALGVPLATLHGMRRRAEARRAQRVAA
jgi:hypothetical protein